jgi:hypothetical protein
LSREEHLFRRATVEQDCPNSHARLLHLGGQKEIAMKYGIAWLLGVPTVIVVGWFVLAHC